GGLGRECARLFNDWVAKLVKGHEEVFLPVAMAPAGCPEAMADELRRCVKDLGFRTSHLVPYCGTRNLDDPSFYPYYQAAEELGVPLLCHPNSNGELVDRFDNFYKTHVLGRPISEMAEDHILMASDYPHFDSEFPHTVASIRARKDITERQKSKILGENAARLLRL